MISEEKIYKVLRSAILYGDFPPGQQLKENSLSEAFGVSRTPIRSVFQRLKYDSLIKIVPKRGAFVYCPSPSEAEQIFSVRMLMEPKAIELAAMNAVPVQIKKMYELWNEERSLIANHNFHKSLVATKNLHLSIVEASGNLYLIEFLRKIITLSHIVLTFYDASDHKESNAINEHFELLEAVKNKKIQEAKRLAHLHVKSIQNDLDFSKEFIQPISVNLVISKYI